MTKPTASPRKGAPRKPEAPAAVTARCRSFRERQEAEGRSRWEIYVSPAEQEDIRQLLRRLRT